MKQQAGTGKILLIAFLFNINEKLKNEKNIISIAYSKRKVSLANITISLILQVNKG